jgi:hypothetical protein
MFRFMIRDVLWLMVVVGLAVLLWLERQKVIAVTQERDEATANWHDASKKWVEATGRIPKNPFHGNITDGAPPGKVGDRAWR